ncbi:STM3941 family protein [Bradyrhizobium sp. WSM1743]|uniref:STM3941 family protein n=1 Tax=Bradyrhizobium sp. WSM1743 TaxID=318996 RepID=UPI00042A9294|nr:STM3941 family protein [Bradyrhizobium sp. WSM1743]
MHAHHEGSAGAESRQSVASTVSIDASCDLEISRCVTQLRLLVAAGFAMTLLSASLALDWWDGLGDYDTTVGYVGVVVFGLVTSWLIWMLPAERGAVVVVTPYGIRDLRIGNEFLPWESIAEISAEECRGHKTIVLTPSPALRRQLCAIPTLARAVKDGRIVIRTEGLATDFDTLLRACRDCHAASSAHTALQQEDERGPQSFAVQVS